MEEKTDLVWIKAIFKVIKVNNKTHVINIKMPPHELLSTCFDMLQQFKLGDEDHEIFLERYITEHKVRFPSFGANETSFLNFRSQT